MLGPRPPLRPIRTALLSTIAQVLQLAGHRMRVMEIYSACEQLGRAMRSNPTRHGAAVLRVEGKRGVVFKIKWPDANGRQVKETLGREADGWTDQKARAELEARLVDVRREGLTRTPAVTFAMLAEEWLDTYPKARGLKTSTTESYRSIVRTHLVDAIGRHRVSTLDVGDLERYVADAIKEGAAPRTVNRHLNIVHAVLKLARRRGLGRENVAELVERPAEPRMRWTILTPVELARVETAFREVIAAAEDDGERRWREQARVVFIVSLRSASAAASCSVCVGGTCSSPTPPDRGFASAKRSCAAG